MKRSLKSVARHAVAAGLCVSMVFAAAPIAAYADEPADSAASAPAQADASQPSDPVTNTPPAEPSALTSYEALCQVVEAAPNGVETVITLEGDIEFSGTQVVNIPAGKIIVLDMAGHKITATADYQGRPFVNEGTLTVKGKGSIDTSASADGGLGAINNKGTLTIVDGTYKGARHSGGSPIRNTGTSAKLHVLNGEFYGTAAIFNEGSVVIEDGKFRSDTCSQCNSGVWSYAIRNNDTSSVMVINGGYFEGVQGAVSAAVGKLVVNDGHFKTVRCPYNDKHTATFYALYAAGEVGEVECIVNGGTFETEGKYATALIGNDADGGIQAKATARINGGVFKAPAGVSPLKGAQKTGDPIISGGTFTSGGVAFEVPEQYLAPGFAVNNETGTVEQAADMVATVSVDGAIVGAYPSLKEAVAAAPKGAKHEAPETPAVITLLKDTNDGFDIGNSDGSAPQNIVLDLNGKTLTLGPAIGSAGTETNGLRVLAFSKLHIKNGKVTNSDVENLQGKRVQFLLVNYSHMTLSDVEVTPVHQARLGINNRGALVLEGSTVVETAPNGYKLAITNDPYNYFYTDFDASITVPEGSDVKVGKVQIERYGNTQNKGGVVLNIASGEFGEFVEDGESAVAVKGNITGGVFTEGIDEEYLADGFGLTQQPDGSFGVHKHVGVKVAAKAPTCDEPGNSEHWKCEECGATFSSDAMTDEVDPVIPAKGHNVAGAIHHKAKDATETEAGNLEHWECPDCRKLFLDAKLTSGTTANEVTVPALGVAKVVVTFVAGNGETFTREVEPGSKIQRPADPSKSGWEFVGWFKTKAGNDMLSDEWDFGKDVVTGDITLYGGWVKKGASAQDPSTPVDKPQGDLPQTGDDSMLPVVSITAAGVLVAGVGVAVAMRRRKAE